MLASGRVVVEDRFVDGRWGGGGEGWGVEVRGWDGERCGGEVSGRRGVREGAEG